MYDFAPADSLLVNPASLCLSADGWGIAIGKRRQHGERDRRVLGTVE
jgi:hypothetical protein